jgi:hypothetical protein
MEFKDAEAFFQEKVEKIRYVRKQVQQMKVEHKEEKKQELRDYTNRRRNNLDSLPIPKEFKTPESFFKELNELVTSYSITSVELPDYLNRAIPSHLKTAFGKWSKEIKGRDWEDFKTTLYWWIHNEHSPNSISLEDRDYIEPMRQGETIKSFNDRFYLSVELTSFKNNETRKYEVYKKLIHPLIQEDIKSKRMG